MTPIPLRRRYAAQERQWVKRLLSTLTDAQYVRYVEACKQAPRCHNGKLYDGAKARIAGEILRADWLARPPLSPLE